MSKVFVSVRLIDEDGDVHDWRGTFDIVIAGIANTKNLVPRLAELILRELVRRGLIAPTEGEVPKASIAPPRRVKLFDTVGSADKLPERGPDGKFLPAGTEAER